MPWRLGDLPAGRRARTNGSDAMDLKERVPFGRTGLLVSRMGLASGYGVPAAAIEKAVHEYGINYLYISPVMNLGSMVEAIRNLATSQRDELCIVLARPLLKRFRLESYVERWLKKLELEWVDLLLQDVRKPSPKLTERVERLQEAGKVRFLGISSHKRPLLGGIARGAVNAPVIGSGVPPRGMKVRPARPPLSSPDDSQRVVAG